MPIDVSLDEEALHVHLSGLDSVWSLRRHIEVPRDSITGAEVAMVDDLRKTLGLRIPGTYVPGLVAAGRYHVRGQPGKIQLWAVYRDDEVLVVDTDLDEPCRLVIQAENRAEIAESLDQRGS